MLSLVESFEKYKEHRSIRNIFCNCSEYGPMDQMLCRVLILALVAILFSRAELGSFGKRPYEEHLYDINLNFG